MASTDFYSENCPGTTTVCGRVSRVNPDPEETWSELHDGAGAGVLCDGSLNIGVTINSEGAPYTDKWWGIRRAIILFDVSSWSGGPIFTAALKLWIGTPTNEIPGASFGVYSSNPASNTTLATADYGRLGTTLYSDLILIDNIASEAVNTFTINDTGLAVISAAIAGDGIVKLGIREGTYDAPNVAPTWASSVAAHILFNHAEQLNQPTLTLTTPDLTALEPFVWIEDTDAPTDRIHLVDSQGVEQSNITVADVDDTPVDGATTAPISSNWAYDYAAVWEDKKKIVYLGL